MSGFILAFMPSTQGDMSVTFLYGAHAIKSCVGRVSSLSTGIAASSSSQESEADFAVKFIVLKDLLSYLYSTSSMGGMYWGILAGLPPFDAFH